MFKLYGFAVPRSGYGFTGAAASVQINDSLTGAAATLFQDDEVNTLTNPLTADSVGMYAAKVKDGTYDITITYSGGATTSMTQVRCFDTLFKKMLNGSANPAVKGNVVFQSGTDGTFTRAADTAMTTANMNAVGMVLSASIANGARGTVCFSRGMRLEGVGAGWTPGVVVYSDAAGTTTQTQPAGISVILGYAASATDLVFDPQEPLAAQFTYPYPLDRNVVINGAMEIWQRTSGALASIANGAFHPDRWKYNEVGISTQDSTRDTSVPTIANAGMDLRYSWKLNTTTGIPAPGAGDYVFISQSVEGFRTRPVAEQATAVSFWVRASKTGSFCVSLVSAAPYSCTRRVTISQVDTWEKKTVYFPAPPTAAAFTEDQTLSCQLRICLASGTTFQHATGNDGVWVAGTFMSETGDTNFASAVSDNFYVTAVQWEAGILATPYQQRAFDLELLLCKRYYWKSFDYDTAVAQNSGSFLGALTYRPAIAGVSAANGMHVRFPARLRVAPTLTFYNPAAANSNWRNVTDTADSGASSVVGTTSAESFTVGNAQVAGDAVGETVSIHASADAEL
jgi:hypothetical protein